MERGFGDVDLDVGEGADGVQGQAGVFGFGHGGVTFRLGAIPPPSLSGALGWPLAWPLGWPLGWHLGWPLGGRGEGGRYSAAGT